MAGNAKADAQDAIYEAISEVVKESEDLHSTTRAAVLRDVAYAYRLISGGAQPGSVEISAK